MGNGAAGKLSEAEHRASPTGSGGSTLGCSRSPSARNSELPLDTAARPRTSLLQALGPMPKL